MMKRRSKFRPLLVEDARLLLVQTSKRKNELDLLRRRVQRRSDRAKSHQRRKPPTTRERVTVMATPVSVRVNRALSLRLDVVVVEEGVQARPNCRRQPLLLRNRSR